MKRIAVLVVFTGILTHGFGWGFYAHKVINRLAVFTLPPELFAFYKAHLEDITEHAVDPDKRRYSDPEEACRHYVDLDYFEHTLPLDTMPRKWKDAVARYTEDTLKAYGIVPWHIQLMMNRLTEAFKEKNIERIIRLSADLGHYIADAHVPLHATINYNGQLTGQQG
ncbi:MAG: zinc dependent phospholipase C family protein, partial [Bacteroidota bacterium]